MSIKTLLVITVFIPSILFSQSDSIKLLSWNIRDFGQTKSNQELEQVAEIVQEVDIIAIQEVVAGYGGAQAVAKLSEILNRKGAKWDYVISDPTKSPAYMTERYAFVWKTKFIKIKNRGQLLKELDHAIDREPLKLDFYYGTKKFSVLNFHSRPYGKNPIPEIEALNKFVINFVNTPLLIAGDFNTNERHEAFSLLKHSGFGVATTNTKTTLKRSCTNGNDYLNYMIDNIFYSKGITKMNGGAIDFVKVCDGLSEARKISDHLPVFLEFTF